ncbi:GTP-binding protein [Pseudomonas sp. W2-17]|uniref:CobW family GTP-binding protein n=1 Tax=Pseudomonas sp. W2-17 TaxID=3058039 RepID=UPI0034E0D538
MLQNIPTHVIAGPLGAGKTSLIRHLLKQKPAHERWAVLINEFGQIGLDAALLTTGDDGIALGEVAGGCLCCVNGAPFQIGLGRLLRRAKPDRLLIEPSGLGHPVQLIKQLHEAPWIGVLAIQPTVMVLDAQALAEGKELPDSQRDALAQAGLLVLNKSEGLDAVARKAIIAALPPNGLYWTDHGVLALDSLPGIESSPHAGSENPAIPRSLPQLPAVWIDPMAPVCLSQQQSEGCSIGWRWHPERVFDAAKVQSWLQTLGWRRAKLVIHSEKGWISGNAVNGSALEWTSSEWRKDSRLELIFHGPQDEATLQTALAACLL